MPDADKANLFAEIAVSPGSPDLRTFTWRVPPGMDAQRGSAVAAPWRHTLTLGIVMQVTQQSEVESPRELAAILDPNPLLSRDQLALAEWIAERYLAPLFSALALFLPPHTQAHPWSGRRPLLPDPPAPIPWLTLADPAAIASLPATRRSRPADLLERLAAGPISVADARRALGGKDPFERWIEETSLARLDAGEVALAIPPDEARAVALGLRRSAAERRQLALLRLLEAGDAPEREACRTAGATSADIEALLKHGWVARLENRVGRPPIPSPHREETPRRDSAKHPTMFSPRREEMPHNPNVLPPLGGDAAGRGGAPALTPDQQHAADAILAAMSAARAARAQPQSDDRPPRSFLLHGVTGSGKTEVYLAAAADALAHGESVVALVPEIALAPQTVARFEARFPGRVAVRHSALRPAAAREQWRQLWTGERQIVVGPRSALFAPLRNLGLIILDEEHEWTYRQPEPHPRYHARDAAEHLAARSDAVLLLGSATPDITTMWRAQSGAQAGAHRLLELPTRVESAPRTTPPPETPLPDVEIIDLRDELRRGNRSVFSRALADALNAALNAGEQALLFLNRRGLAAYVCRACGAAVECAACQLPLTLHRAGPVLQCHECGRRERAAAACPACGDERLRPMSFGLQRIEDELRAQFGDIPISRWDRDSLRAAGGHAAILDEFASGRSRVLIGTQMIAKGLDVPAVTVAGVLNADLSLRMPDYTAPERTFQLLTQVAGRAGRGGAPGRVIIQTYSPDHYAVQSAAAHDYASFYEAEMRLRALLDYPPYGRLARILCSARTVAAADELAETVRDRLARAAAASIEPPPEIIGPSEPWPARLRGRWRRQIVLRGPDPAPLLRAIELPRGCTVEIDPASLL